MVIPRPGPAAAAWIGLAVHCWDLLRKRDVQCPVGSGSGSGSRGEVAPLWLDDCFDVALDRLKEVGAVNNVTPIVQGCNCSCVVPLAEQRSVDPSSYTLWIAAGLGAQGWLVLGSERVISWGRERRRLVRLAFD